MCLPPLQWLFKMRDSEPCFTLSSWLWSFCCCCFCLCRIWLWYLIVKYNNILWSVVFSTSADLEFRPGTWVPCLPCFFKILGYVKCCEQFPLSLRKIKDPADQAAPSTRMLVLIHGVRRKRTTEQFRKTHAWYWIWWAQLGAPCYFWVCRSQSPV